MDIDGISTWIQNRQFLDQIEDGKLDEMRDEIIETLFGSTKALIKHCIGRLHLVFSDTQQSKLNKILVNLVEPIDNNLSLTCLPDDCLSHTLSFLSIYEKGTVQHCCRSLLIAARKPSSCCDPNNIESNLYELKGVSVYQRKIAKLILSDKADDNLQAVASLNEYIKVNLLVSISGQKIEIFLDILRMILVNFGK